MGSNACQPNPLARTAALCAAGAGAAMVTLVALAIIQAPAQTGVGRYEIRPTALLAGHPAAATAAPAHADDSATHQPGSIPFRRALVEPLPAPQTACVLTARIGGLYGP